MFILQDQYTKDQLQDAVSYTFEARKTEYNKQKPSEIIHEYAINPNNMKMWKIFLKKINTEPITFDTVTYTIQNKIIDNG